MCSNLRWLGCDTAFVLWCVLLALCILDWEFEERPRPVLIVSTFVDLVAIVVTRNTRRVRRREGRPWAEL